MRASIPCEVKADHSTYNFLLLYKSVYHCWTEFLEGKDVLVHFTSSAIGADVDVSFD